MESTLKDVKYMYGSSRAGERTTVTTKPSVMVGENDNPSSASNTITTNFAASASRHDEAPSRHHERRFPNDLTSKITREGHDPVASGGFADIYKGILQWNSNSIKVAIKTIRIYSGEDADFAKKEKRLRREVKVWLGLEHDNILPLLGTTIGFSRFPAMVCPWAENVKILRLLNNVASGLQYLHSRSIVHGDLSGSNIFVNKNGNAWIADFGLSTLLTELGGATFATSFHARGTLRWIAPELLGELENELQEGQSYVSPTTYNDVYSFGGVMLQILSGNVPYHYLQNDMLVMGAILKGITPKRPRNALVTERRWKFIQQCWTTVGITRSRPTSDQIVDFTENEFTCVSVSDQSFVEISPSQGVAIEVHSEDVEDAEDVAIDLTSQITREGNFPVAVGGSADIYRGMLQLNAKSIRVAIKVIKAYFGEDAEITKNKKRFRRAVKVWLSLEHDNILPLLGTTIGFSRFPAMVCSWAENGTLTSYLKDRYTNLSVVEILGLLHGVASGLQYLHSRSIIHGNLSGSNILISENGKALITDFGLSTLLTELELGVTMFQTSFRPWALRWVAPELLELEDGPSNIYPTTQNDVYSFGSIMLQILSGNMPYHYLTRDTQIINEIFRGARPKRPSNALVTEHRWKFIQRCWSTVNITRSRPTSDQIAGFTKNEFAIASHQSIMEALPFRGVEI